jgi:hypothetical protein
LTESFTVDATESIGQRLTESVSRAAGNTFGVGFTRKVALVDSFGGSVSFFQFNVSYGTKRFLYPANAL